MRSCSTIDRRVVVDGDDHVWRVAADPARSRARTGVDLRLLIPAVVAWALSASVLGRPWPERLAAGTLLVLAAGAVIWLGRPRHRRHGRALRLCALVSLVTGLVLCAGGAADQLRRAGPVDEIAARSGVARISGLVTGEPADIGNGRYLVRVRAQAVVAGALAMPASAGVLVLGDQRWAALTWHRRIDALVRLEPAQPADAVLAVGKPLSAPVVDPRVSSVVAASAHVRQRLRDATAQLPADARGLVPAMVFGDTSRSPPTLTDDMRDTGLTHLSAVSGANVSILLAAVAPLLTLLGIPRRVRPPVLLLVVAGFVVVTRPEPSVIRAAVMGGIGLLALYRSSRSAGTPVLSAAIVVLLCIDPWLARSPGFALSALATLGLLLFAGPWSEALAARLPRWLRFTAVVLVLPVAAQVFTLPIIVVLQGDVSLVGVPANVLAALFVAPVTIAGLVVAVVAVVALPTAWLAWAAGLPAMAIAEIAHRGARVPWATMPWPDGTLGAGLATMSIVLVLLTFPMVRYAVTRRPRRAVAGAALLVAGWFPTGWWAWPPASWQLVACDVGQGDALVLRSGPGRGVLIDAGPEPRAVDRCLHRLGVHVLDLVVLTHFHADHVDGLSGALRGRRASALLVTPVADPPDRAAAVADLARARGIPTHLAHAGDRFSVGEVTLTVLAPSRPIAAGSVPNNASIVLVARSAGLDALLTGDIEAEAGRRVRTEHAHDLMTTNAMSPRFDVVKAPHHGSGNLDPELTMQTKAPLTLVSVGADNDYGHPSPRMLALAKRIGTQVARTDELGDIAVWESAGRVYLRSTHRW